MPNKSEAKRRISKAREEIFELNDLNVEAPEFIRWRRGIRVAVSNAFGVTSGHVREIDRINFSPFGFIVGGDNSAEIARSYRDGLNEASALLQSMLDEIEEYWADDNPPQPVSELQLIHEQEVSNRVFVVHGRDGGARNTVARFLETLGLEPVILQEQPNEGRTIIQKFEDHSGVGFAVVLCTPDDVGALSSEKDKLRPRPRQNVILELGFFWGRLGRKKVCALLEGEMDMPSDYGGVLYIPLDDAEGWKLTLARELRAAGMTIDMNLIV